MITDSKRILYMGTKNRLHLTTKLRAAVIERAFPCSFDKTGVDPNEPEWVDIPEWAESSRCEIPCNQLMSTRNRQLLEMRTLWNHSSMTPLKYGSSPQTERIDGTILRMKFDKQRRQRPGHYTLQFDPMTKETRKS